MKGRDLPRDPRVTLVIDDETPPFAFVMIEGTAVASRDVRNLEQVARRISQRSTPARGFQRTSCGSPVAATGTLPCGPTRIVARERVGVNRRPVYWTASRRIMPRRMSTGVRRLLRCPEALTIPLESSSRRAGAMNMEAGTARPGPAARSASAWRRPFRGHASPTQEIVNQTCCLTVRQPARNTSSACDCADDEGAIRDGTTTDVQTNTRHDSR